MNNGHVGEVRVLFLRAREEGVKEGGRSQAAAWEKACTALRPCPQVLAMANLVGEEVRRREGGLEGYAFFACAASLCLSIPASVYEAAVVAANLPCPSRYKRAIERRLEYLVRKIDEGRLSVPKNTSLPWYVEERDALQWCLEQVLARA